MLAKKKAEIFTEVFTQRELDKALKENRKKLVCAEIFYSAFGACTALDRPVFSRFKFEWDVNQVCAFLRVQCDEVPVFERCVGRSIPFLVFMTYDGEEGTWRVKNSFLGVDSIKFQTLAMSELKYFERALKGDPDIRPSYALDEPTPLEVQWVQRAEKEILQEKNDYEFKRALRQAARKRHRAELMVPYLKHLNFVLFWPHMKHAHVELYERWDKYNIIMVGREEIQLDEEKARDVLYGGDAPINEASMFALLQGPALAICFRALDDVDFVPLVRQILYEIDDSEAEMSKHDEKRADEKRRKSIPLRITAYEHYKTFSPPKQQIWQMRRKEKENKKKEKKYRRERLLSEKQRMARQAIQDELAARKLDRENRKMEYLKTGNLVELEKLNAEPEDTEEDVDIVVPEELSELSEEESEVEEDENEYFPPPGLVVPGFYAPPNEVAKANGLAVLFPKHVTENVALQPEFLPPHVLIMVDMQKRHKAIQTIAKYKKYIIHMGIFYAQTPYDSKHVAYSVKEFDAMDGDFNLEELKLCFMMSTEKDFGVLTLMDLSPCHVSRDEIAGELECAVMFSVDYGDNERFEDFEEEKEE